MKQSFISIVTITATTLFLHGCGKLAHNNPGDTKSRSFFETVLLNFLLKPSRPTTCTTTSRWEKSFGSGTYKTVIDGFVTLPNEDIIVAGFTNEDLGTGRNNHFTGTSGSTANGFIARLDGNDGSQKWLDYLGQIDGDVGIRISKFSNGEVLFSYLAYSEQLGFISPTANLGVSTPSFALARFDINGNRKWHTYLDSTDLAATNIAEIDSTDQIHILARLNGTNGHQAFIEFPAASNSAGGSTGDTDILYGIVSSSGVPKSQMYISGTGGDVPSAIVRVGTNMYIAGSTTQIVNGYTGHPSIGYERVFVLKVNESQSISWLNYRGAVSATSIGSVTEFKTDGKDLYLLARASDTFDSPISPYQNISGTKNYVFQKIDFNGSNQWLTFLGSNTTSISEGFRIPILIPENGSSLYSTLLGPQNGTRYTGHASVETGDGTNILQRVTTKIGTSSGSYEKVIYDTNDTAPQKSHYTILSEMCSGKLVRGERVIPDINDTNRLSFKIKVFPTSELP